MTQTGHVVSDIGRSVSWRALDSFLTHIKPDSAIAKEIDPDYADWSSTIKTNAILADIYDLLAVINAHLSAVVSGKKPKQPKPYPRIDDKKTKKQMTLGEMKAKLEGKK